MAFTTSFQVSMELTKLIPMGGVAAWKAAEGLLSLARDIQSSGSDIVIEADLAEMFGRSRIEPQMASTFKSVISRNSSSKLCEGISLESGPGPTTLRALKPEQLIYFSTVIQCSLLAYVLQRDDLAAIIKSIFDKRAEEAPPNQQMRASPSAEGIVGFLQVCEDQTAEYQWNNLLLTVSTMLGLQDAASSEAISGSVLEGLISSLTLVQHFPEEWNIQIESPSGVCLIVVWAHFVLGLSVMVKTWHDGDPKHTVFGNGQNHIMIDTSHISKNRLVEPSFTLLGCTKDNSQEPLFHIRPDPDELKLESIYRIPAKGYGTQVLSSMFDGSRGKQEVFVPEMVNVTCAFAMIIAGNLRAARRTPLKNQEHDIRQGTNDNDDDGDDDERGSTEAEELPEEEPCPVDSSQVMRAGQFLFGNKLSEAAIKGYVALYQGQPLNQSLQRPMIMDAWYKTQKDWPKSNWVVAWDVVWSSSVQIAQHLSVLILAFSYVQDLPSCAEMMLDHNCGLLRSHALAEQILDWDGKESLKVTEFAWFYAITILLVDHSGINEDGVALLSNRGWSIYFSTFGLQPPSDTKAGHLSIKKGTPYRNGMYRHAVIDGWDKGREEKCEWQRVQAAGSETKLSCANNVVLGRAIYGEYRDAFVVSLRMICKDAGFTCIRRAGYQELYGALWMVQKTTPCNHSPRSQTTMTLPPGAVTISGFSDFELPNFDERLQVCLTANQDIARWRVLLAIVSARMRVGQKQEYVMLRGNDCCLKCALEQASMRTQQCILVL